MFTPRGPILSPSYRHNFLSHNTFSYEGRRLHPIQLGVTGIPLRSELPCKLLKYSTIGIEPPDFCFYSMGLKR